jgi:hypothetical protein
MPWKKESGHATGPGSNNEHPTYARRFGGRSQNPHLREGASVGKANISSFDFKKIAI